MYPLNWKRAFAHSRYPVLHRNVYFYILGGMMVLIALLYLAVQHLECHVHLHVRVNVVCVAKGSAVLYVHAQGCCSFLIDGRNMASIVFQSS